MCQLQVFILFFFRTAIFPCLWGKCPNWLWCGARSIDCTQILTFRPRKSPPWQPPTSFQPAADCKFLQKNKYLQVVGERERAREGEQEQCADRNLSSPFSSPLRSISLNPLSLALSYIEIGQGRTWSQNTASVLLHIVGHFAKPDHLKQNKQT